MNYCGHRAIFPKIGTIPPNVGRLVILFMLFKLFVLFSVFFLVNDEDKDELELELWNKLKTSNFLKKFLIFCKTLLKKLELLEELLLFLVVLFIVLL